MTAQTQPDKPAGRFELPLPPKPETLFSELDISGNPSQYAFEPLLLKNEAWYCQLRWVVIFTFILFGGLTLIPGILPVFGFQPGWSWPWTLAAILLPANLFFLWHISWMRRTGRFRGLKENLWAQILFDLIVVTATIHVAGGFDTDISFLYLFHIVLSCIFLQPAESLAVTAVACLLYLGCAGLELNGILRHPAVSDQGAFRSVLAGTFGYPWLKLGIVVFMLGMVWFLASRLSARIRKREQDLMQTNHRLLQLQKEKMQFMLQTTHELKAPFAAIQANTQLLLKGYCGELPAEALEIMGRINERSHRLAYMIREMLQLANLRSQSEGPLRMTQVTLVPALGIAIEQVRQIAEEHGVTLVEELREAYALGLDEHLKILFLNLLNNAILYSHKGGRVMVRCQTGIGGGAVVSIEDNGIGIPQDKLSKIFDEYYRTNEALQHNKDSTGLGLAIVRHIAETHRIRIVVESTPNQGTCFTLFFNPC